MGITKGSGNKLSKIQTNRSNPIVSQPVSLRKGIAFTDHENIDENNPSTLYFHILGDIPSEIKLFLFAERFNQNFYTELGIHSHNSGTLSTGDAFGTAVDHNHTFNHEHSFVFDAESEGTFHHHAVRVHPPHTNDSTRSLLIDDGDSGHVYTAPESGLPYVNPPANFEHNHDIGGDIEGANTNDTSVTSGLDNHVHAVNMGNTGLTGVAPSVGSLNTVAAKEFFDSLQIEIDGVDQTAVLLAQAGLAQFGDGTDTNVIVTDGIELDLTSFISTPGEHKIIFSLGGVNNGGKVRYNLYLLD